MKENPKNHPPRWIQNLLKSYCDPFLYEGIAGDLLETYYRNLEAHGHQKASWIYCFQSLGFIRTSFKQKRLTMTPFSAIWMNYFRTTLRTIGKHKLYFIISLLGLVLAIASGWFATVYILDELQFDRMHSAGDQIYRLYRHSYKPDENVDHHTYETSGMMAPTIMEDYPEVAAYARVCPWFESTILSLEETSVSTEGFYFADSVFFDFFDFPVVRGNPAEFLTAPATIVLSESMAQSLFGRDDPMGKVIIGLQGIDYTVTGIFKDVPRHSSMQFEAVASWSTTVPNVGPLNYNWMNNWFAQGIFSYIQLHPGNPPTTLQQKLPEMMQAHFPERADQYTLKLISLKDMYLSSDWIKYDRGGRKGSMTFVMVLGFSALLIMVMASLNYINIAISRAAQARHEVGVRKVLGSSRLQLMGRFMMETFFSTTVAAIVAIAIVLVWLPEINAISGKNLPREVFAQPLALGGIVLFIFFLTFATGSYPSWIMAKPQVAGILKGETTGGKKSMLKKGLLALQYAMSILLIICALFITKQINYLENKPLGFEKDGVLVVDLNNEVGEKAEVFENELLKHPNILDISTSRSAIGAGSYSTTIYPEGSTEETTIRLYAINPGFFEVYGMNMHLGRSFIRGSIADSANMIVNEAFVAQMGWKDPLGKRIRFQEDGDLYPIIGVVEDFHYRSLAQDQIEPMVLYLNPEIKYNSSIKLGNGDIPATLEHIEKTWDQLATRTPLQYYFVDGWFNERYKKERQLFKIAILYALISLVLSGLGLYGLTSLQLQQQRKEITIRKILGASVNGIAGMVNRQYLVIIAISFLTMTPLGYFLVRAWLSKFAYRISMDIGPFVTAGLITLLGTVIIVTVLAIRHANVNPAQTLRTE